MNADLAFRLWRKHAERAVPEHRLFVLPAWLWLGRRSDGLAIGPWVFLHASDGDEADYCHELEHVRQWHIFGPRMWAEWLRFGFGQRNRFEALAYALEDQVRADLWRDYGSL
jgi:hypothetical protein